MTQPARFPDNEAERLRALQQLEVLDSAPEPAFDALVKVASMVCGVPISLISLIDAERQWFKANLGLPEATQTPRDVAFCAHAILEDEIFEVADASADPRFASNPLVTGQPDIRFYAGMPLTLSDGLRIGTLCVIDRQPRQLNPAQREMLRCLGLAAARALELRRNVAQEARARAVLRNSLDAVIGLDAQGRVIFWNPAAEQMLGHPSPARIGQGLADLEAPGQKVSLSGLLQSVQQSGRAQLLEMELLQASGARVVVASSATPVLDGQGQVLGTTLMLRDLRERQRQEQALASSEARYRALTDLSPLGVFAADAKGHCTYTNARWQQIFGLSAIEALDDGWTRTVHPEDRARFTASWEHCARLQTEFRLDFRVTRRDGAVRFVRARARPVLDAWGYLQSFVGAVEDMTEQRQSEEALRRSQEMLDRTNRLAGVGGWELDLQTQRLWWSDETCRIHGLQPGHPPDLAKAIDFYAPEVRETVRAAVAAAMERGTPWEAEWPLLRADGQRIWVHAQGQAERVEGRSVRLFGAFQDITERVQARQALERAHARISLATRSGGIGVWEFEADTNRLHWDARMHEIYGTASEHTPSYETWRDRVHPDDLAATETVLQQALAGGSPYDVEFRVLRPDGQLRHVRSMAQISRDAEDRPLRITGVSWDVSDTRRMQQELLQQHELLAVTLASIGDAVITTTASGEIDWMNPVAERLTGWAVAEAKGRLLPQVFHIVNEATRLPAENPIARCLTAGATVGLPEQTLLLARDGTEYGIEDSASPIRSKQGEVLGAVLVFHDVTEQRRLSGEMSYRATHDDLTGLLNRREFDQRLKNALSRAQAEGSVHALLYIDLDQFKLVNDACGHSAGDRLLQQVARWLGDALRSRDIVARLGGDEFAALLEHCSDHQALSVAQKICDRMESYRFEHEGQRFRVGTSIGLVPIDARWNGVEAIMRAADSCCYAAKEAGRNRVQPWLEGDRAISDRNGQMQWTTRLEQALDENRFELYAQRILRIDAPEPATAGVQAEVLLRLRERDGSLVAPGAFLPAAERFHLITRIDRWVLQAVLAWLQQHPQAEHHLSVNLSGQSLGDRAFHRDVLALLQAQTPQLRRNLCLEVTETAAITQLADASLFVEQLRGLGVQVALDDFGAGMSSFGYLKNLPVHRLKIDGQFVRDLLADPLDHAAVRSFIEVARLVQLDSVAECVESPEVLAELERLGVQYAQGFLLHRPEPLEALWQAKADAGSQATCATPNPQAATL